MGKNRILFIFSALAILALASCSDFRKIQKSNDWRKKYDAAVQYYEKKDYYRSVILFEEIMPYIRGTQENELVQYYYAYAHYYQKQYLLSSHYFKTFYETYNRSEYAEEAYYMYAYSLFKESPKFNLDQTSSVEAIVAMQTFMNKYPRSEYRDKAAQIINDLQVKLEKKNYENARQYYVIGYYVAAQIAFDNFERDFPDSHWNEEIAYLRVKTEYDMARKSIMIRQKDRFQKCVDYYHRFVDTYPESKYLKDAEDMYSASIQNIEKLSKNNP
ncbi:MAG: outer membrane protein assembly factor BamD [Cyclobacteriaceae bacterium]